MLIRPALAALAAGTLLAACQPPPAPTTVARRAPRARTSPATSPARVQRS